MKKESNALRLADVLEDIFIPVIVDRQQAAAELRRLHEVNQELLEALKSLIDMDVAYQRGPRVEEAVEVARAAIAKAEAK